MPGERNAVFVELAAKQAWGVVFAEPHICLADVNDYDSVRARWRAQ